MSNIKERLVQLADSLDNNGHIDEATMIDNIIEHIAQSTDAKVTTQEKVDVIKDRYNLIGDMDLMYKRFTREISDPHYKYLGDDIIENAKQKFEQLNNILEMGKEKQSDIAGQELT